jgi:hypothetical protein
MVKKVYEWKPMAIGSLGRPQSRWENDVKNDLNTMKIYTVRQWIRQFCNTFFWFCSTGGYSYRHFAANFKAF